MKQKDFLKRLADEYAKNVEISSRKNADYANDDDAFLNFRACQMLGIDPRVGLLVRMSDKLVRAANLMNREAKVEDEKVGDTLADLANYAMILKLFNESEPKPYAARRKEQK